MRKSLQFALAAGSMFIFTSAAMAQDATVRLSPLFQIQPEIAQGYSPYSVPPSMIWRAPVFPHTWDVQAVVPFTLEETRPPALPPSLTERGQLGDRGQFQLWRPRRVS
jgi:hypothetical protein